MRNRLFIMLLAVMTAMLGLYTLIALQKEGLNLFTVFFGQVGAMGWSGQFNLDFMCYLLLSGLWIMWRSMFSWISIAIGLAAAILGIVFFAPYLLWLIFQHKGDLKAVLLGKNG